MTVLSLCEQGPCRAENQDAILSFRHRRSGLFLVADGVGGCPDGAGASRYLAERYRQWWQQNFLPAPGRAFSALFAELKQLAEEANEALCRTNGAGNSCSTLVVLFLHQGIYGYLSCGDSRIYLSGRAGARLLTRDDTWENEPDTGADSPNAGKLVSAVGSRSHLEYASATGRTHWGEVFLLCSDGLYKFVEPAFLQSTMIQLYRSLFFRRAPVEELVRQALCRGTNDNYSLIAVKV